MKKYLGFILMIVLVIVSALAITGCNGDAKSVSNGNGDSTDDSGSTDVTTGISVTVPVYESETSGLFTINVASLSWVKVDSTIATHMNAMEGYANYGSNTYVMSYASTTSKPDLTSVGGAGLYIQSTTDSTASLYFGELKLAPATGTAVDETFAGSSWGAIFGWYGYETIKPSAATGFGWGGYASGSVKQNLIVIQSSYSGMIAFVYDSATGSGNDAGSYAYSIFSSSAGTTPTSIVDISSGTITIQLATPSGLTAQPAEEVRLLIRDANGDWYLSVGGTATAA